MGDMSIQKCLKIPIVCATSTSHLLTLISLKLYKPTNEGLFQYLNSANLWDNFVKFGNTARLHTQI